MTDEPLTSAGSGDDRPPVARLAEALAAAQAVARSSEQDAPPEAEDLSDRRLRDRIDELPTVNETTGETTGKATGVADEPESSPVSTAPPRKRLWPLHIVMAILVLAVPVIGFIGYRIASTSTAGEVLSGRSRPSAPGYTALVESTPVALVMHTSDEGEAESLTVLSLSGPDQRGGAVVVSPIDVRLRKPVVGFKTFSALMTSDHSRLVGQAIGSHLGLGFTEVLAVTDSDLSRLVAPVAPLQIDNPEEVTTSGGATIPAGAVELDAEQVPAYLGADDAGHTSSGRLARQQLVWAAWIQAVATAGTPSAVPGETDSGFGHYLRRLAAGSVQTSSFPVVAAGDLDGAPTVRIDKDLAMLLVANAVPFPVAAIPGERATTVLLNGTGPGQAPLSVIQRVTYAGAQITTVGNAGRFDNVTTTVHYTNPRARLFALAMVKQLGVGKVVADRSSDVGTDVTIVLGRDVISNPPAPLTPEAITGAR